MHCKKGHIAGLLLAFIGFANAQTETTHDDWVHTYFNWLEDQRNFLSSQITTTAYALDKYIARDSFKSDQPNESYVRIRGQQILTSGFDEYHDLSIRARIDIPNTEERVNIFFNSEPDDFDSISQRRRNITGTNSEESSVAGVSFLGRQARKWKTDFSIGARFRLPPDPYTKFKVKRYDDLGGLWQSRFQQSVSYYHSRSWRASTEYDIYRPINGTDIIRISSEAQFFDSENYWEFYHGYSYHHPLDKKTAIELSTGLNGFSQPNPRVDNTWLRVEWRRKIYKDWLYGKISPELSFPRSRNFKDTYSLFFELELFFGDDYVPSF
jgi:hypothetical protein